MITRPVYMITLRAEPNTDPIRALRGALKMLARRYGLRAITIRELANEDEQGNRQADENKILQ